MRLHFLQHVDFEGLGSIHDWILKSGHTLTQTQLFISNELPAIKDIDGLIIMGGSMSIGDELQYPWLAVEKEYIKQAMAAKLPVLGICMGAQILADLLGAKVYRNENSEIGWFPVQLTNAARQTQLFDVLPDQFNVMHWHGDTFDIPAGAMHLASSLATPNQGFLYQGHVLAMQFHLELKEQDMELMIEYCGNDIEPGEFTQSVEELENSRPEIAINNQWLDQILSAFFKS